MTKSPELSTENYRSSKARVRQVLLMISRWSGLTHQFSFGGVMDLPLALRLSFAAHFYSALPATLYLPPSGGGDIFTDDLTGDGTGGGTTDFSRGDVLPGTNLGAFGRTVHGGSGLNKVIDSFNSSVAGTPTPAGQAVVNAGLMTPRSAHGAGWGDSACNCRPLQSGVSGKSQGLCPEGWVGIQGEGETANRAERFLLQSV